MQTFTIIGNDYTTYNLFMAAPAIAVIVKLKIYFEIYANFVN